ncbi:MAG TPA: nucleoside deaminase [Thermoanaerobaculia bacterium]|jgi:tRNA(Arg) A34 adenosine deaminase TadA
MYRTIIALLLLLSLGCASVTTTDTSCPPAPPPYQPTAEQVELDTIYSLLAYAVVYVNWQPATQESRGYNIGSVLVDPEDNVVCWAVNSVGVTGNGTQHGEVRLITNYVGNTRTFSLPKHAIYTTLEPCAMCSGMMTMQSIAKTVYGQRDPDYGATLERLALNSTAAGGYCPFPRTVVSVETESEFAAALDRGYARYHATTKEPRLTRFLASSEAQQIYAAAYKAFLDYKPVHAANEARLAAAREFLRGVPTSYMPIPYTTNCPAGSAAAPVP